MKSLVIDTGPLVAYLDRSEPHHAWAKAELGRSQAPALVCEPVVAEATHLLRRVHGGQEALGAMLGRGGIAVRFQLATENLAVFELMRRYRNVPMSLADGCVVRMSELYPTHTVLTTDSDFAVYRRFKRDRIPVSRPR